MEPTLTLPKTIVLEAACVMTCRRQLLDELWHYRTYRDLALADVDHNNWTIDDLREERPQLRAMRRRPWWVRREWVASHWDDALQRRIASRLLVAPDHGRWPPWLRVHPRGCKWVVEGPWDPARVSDARSAELCESLVSTLDYAEWMAAGGDPDLGRWIAFHEEMKLQGPQ